MTEARLSAIAAACDRLLRAHDTSLARIAIPSLHVVSEHPDWIAQYASLGGGSRAIDDIAPGVLVNGARLVVRTWRAAARTTDQGLDRLALGHADVLLVSHVSNGIQLREETDFYFGDLQRELAARGVTSLLAGVNHSATEDEAELRSTAFRPLPNGRVLLPTAVPPVTEFAVWRACVAARGSLEQAARADSPELDGSLARLARRDVMRHQTAANLRLHHWIAYLCQQLQPTLVITTYEGDAGERMIWHAARLAAPGALCVGYQHTRVFPRSHAVRRAVSAPGHPCDPDVVLTTGTHTRDDLAESPALGTPRLIVYGSHRRALVPNGDQGPRAWRCLVLPEASARERELLFTCAIQCALLQPASTFVLRPHPMASTSDLFSRRNLPANVVVSTAPLDRDFAGARYCLYRGSSAALFAVLAGLKPFYLALPGELPFDPLSDAALNGWRETVTSAADLAARISSAETTPRDEAAAAAARRWCDRYISPLRPEAVDRLVEIVRDHAT